MQEEEVILTISRIRKALMELEEIIPIAIRIRRELTNVAYTSSSTFLIDVEELTKRIINAQDNTET